MSDIGLILKWGAVGGMLCYCLFAAVVVKQARVMTESVEDEANGAVKAVAMAHLLLAVVTAVLAGVIL